MHKPALSDFSKALARIYEILSVKGLKSFDALKAYWSPEYQGRRLNRQIINLVSYHGPEASKNIFQILKTNFSGSNHSQPGLPNEYLQLFADMILAVNQGQLNQQGHDQLLDLTQVLDFKVLPDSTWRALQFIATANGLFQVGLIFRGLTTQRILAADIRNFHQKSRIIRYFNAAMDRQEYLNALEAIQQYEIRHENDKTLDLMKLHYHLMQGQHQDTLKIAGQYYGKNDQEFAKYVQGKRIAIVGPAPGGDSVADEIDQFDIVIRTNYRGRSTLPPADEFGSKIDVSYYNYTYTKQVLGTGDNSYLDDLRFAVFKNEIDINRYKGRRSTAQFRIMNQINDHILNGKSQMVQNIIYDLLHFDPKEIKIFKSNFFMSNQRYYSTYASPSNQSQKVSNFWINFATHDLVTQLNFSRTLFREEQLTADNQAKAVLNLSNEDYIKTIQNIYSMS